MQTRKDWGFGLWREGRGARCVHLRTKMASLSVTDLKGAVWAVGGGSRGGPVLRPFSLCVGFCSEGKLNLKCTFKVELNVQS